MSIIIIIFHQIVHRTSSIHNQSKEEQPASTALMQQNSELAPLLFASNYVVYNIGFFILGYVFVPERKGDVHRLVISERMVLCR